MVTKTAYKLTGLVIFIVGVLFFLRDIGPDTMNFIGNTSGWTIIIVLLGAGLIAGDFELKQLRANKNK